MNDKKKKNKKSSLATAASRRLQSIGQPKMSPAQVAHVMYHAEERGEVERVNLDDGSWAWLLPQQPDGKRPMLAPTPEMLHALERLAQGLDHNH